MNQFLLYIIEWKWSEELGREMGCITDSYEFGSNKEKVNTVANLLRRKVTPYKGDKVLGTFDVLVKDAAAELNENGIKDILVIDKYDYDQMDVVKYIIGIVSEKVS